MATRQLILSNWQFVLTILGFSLRKKKSFLVFLLLLTIEVSIDLWKWIYMYSYKLFLPVGHVWESEVKLIIHPSLFLLTFLYKQNLDFQPLLVTADEKQCDISFVLAKSHMIDFEVFPIVLFLQLKFKSFLNWPAIM